MKLNLNDFDKIVFDMDGVITSELSYWQSAALGAYDMLLSHQHYGVCGLDRKWLRKNYIDIYNTVMCGGRTVKAVKRLGVNTNWDLLYVVFCVSKYINPDLSSPDAAHFHSVCMFIENIDLNAPKLYDALAALAAQSLGKSSDAFKRSGSFFKEGEKGKWQRQGIPHFFVKNAGMNQQSGSDSVRHAVSGIRHRKNR